MIIITIAYVHIYIAIGIIIIHTSNKIITSLFEEIIMAIRLRMVILTFIFPYIAIA